MENKIHISIVIVNYRTPQLTVNCLESISEDFSEDLLISVIVADNDSGDGSALFIADEIKKRGWNSWASVMPLEKNGGFAYGNNRVIEKILNSPQPPDHIWLLNPDTIVYKGACEQLAEFLSMHPKVGIVGSRLEDQDGSFLCSAFRFHSFVSEFIHGANNRYISKILKKWIVPLPGKNKPHQADWLTGASVMIRREVFEEIGLLDERYFMYFEESDFCLNAWRNGWQCWHVPTSRVMHLEGASSNINKTIKRKMHPAVWYESRQHYFMKNYGIMYMAAADLAWLLGHGLWEIRQLVYRKPAAFSPCTVRKFMKHSSLLSWRRQITNYCI